MAETRWTPGPWCVEAQNASVWTEDGMLQVAHCLSVPGVGMVWDRDELHANARLIAAAPELYAALEWITHVACGVSKAGPDEVGDARLRPGEYEAAIAAAIAALAKARGEA